MHQPCSTWAAFVGGAPDPSPTAHAGDTASEQQADTVPDLLSSDNGLLRGLKRSLSVAMTQTQAAPLQGTQGNESFACRCCDASLCPPEQVVEDIGRSNLAQLYRVRLASDIAARARSDPDYKYAPQQFPAITVLLADQPTPAAPQPAGRSPSMVLSGAAVQQLSSAGDVLQTQGASAMDLDLDSLLDELEDS